MKRLAMILAMAPLVWAAQQQPARKGAPAKAPAPQQWPIRELRVEGNQVYTAAQVIALSGLKPGDLGTKENFERARDRILSSGFFESFGWKYEGTTAGDGIVATLLVTEPGQFLPWALDRVPVERAAFEARVKQALPLFGEKIPASDLVLEKAARILETMAAEKGVKGAMIGRVTLLGTDKMGVLFGPKTPPPQIAEVRFAGARVIDPRYLVKAMAEVAVGAPYVEANFHMFLDNQIRAMYDAAGRLRAAFPKITLEPSKTGPGVAVTVQVEEGPAYTLGKIEVRGTPLSPEEIQQEGQFKSGQQVSFSDIGRGLNRIMERLKISGYMKAAYKAQRRLDDEKKTVDILVDMDPGPRYVFGKLEIKGLDLESEPVVRKLWAMKPGEPFKGDYPDQFLNRIRERGLFDNLGETKADVKVSDSTATVDVVLIFKGAPPPPPRKQ